MVEGCIVLISTRGRYALRVMVDLAEHRSEGFIPLKVINDYLNRFTLADLMQDNIPR